MKRVLAHAVQRWRLPLVCCAWLVTLLGLLARNGHETYLAAGFLPIVTLAAAVLVPMAFFSLMRRVPPRFGVREALGTAIILLPLVHIHFSKGTILGAGALTARYVGSGFVAGESPPSVRGDGDAETSLLALFVDAGKYDGRSVRVVGMLAKDNPQVERLLGVRRPVLFRFAISCCAADAAPLALILETDDTAPLRDDDWIEASGTFRIRVVGKLELPVLEEAAVRPAERPEQPYLYPQWGLF